MRVGGGAVGDDDQRVPKILAAISSFYGGKLDLGVGRGSEVGRGGVAEVGGSEVRGRCWR